MAVATAYRQIFRDISDYDDIYVIIHDYNNIIIQPPFPIISQDTTAAILRRIRTHQLETH